MNRRLAQLFVLVAMCGIAVPRLASEVTTLTVGTLNIGDVASLWFDQLTRASANGGNNGVTAISLAVPIVIPRAGDVTKVRFDADTFIGTHTLKCAIYSSNGATRYGSGSVLKTSATAPGLIEYELAAPIELPSAGTYLLAWVFSTADSLGDIQLLSGQPSGSLYVDVATDYAAFPKTTFPVNVPTTTKYCAGFYLMP